MIIQISRIRLLNEITKISRISSNKSPIPELTGILFEVKPEKLILTGSDGFISIQSEIENGEDFLQIKSVGSVLIKTKFVIEVIRKIESDLIKIEVVEGSIIRINAENFDSQINTLKTANYPNINFNVTGKKILFENSILREIINETIFAIDEKDRRVVLTGIRFKLEAKKLKITATDSFRLAQKEISFEHADDFDIIIPGKVLQELIKLINDFDDVIFIINERNIVFKISNTIIQSKIIEGKYPETDRIIPENFNTIIKIKSKDFISAIDRASVLSYELDSTIIKMVIKNNLILIESSSFEIGNSNEELKEFILEGELQAISFNSRYMLDAVRAFKTKNINIKLIDDLKPILITSEENKSLLQLILPIKTY